MWRADLVVAFSGRCEGYMAGWTVLFDRYAVVTSGCGTATSNQATAQAILSHELAHSRQPCQLDRIISDVLPLVRPELRRHGISLQMALAVDPPPVMGDRIQLQQVFINLLVNAAEAMREVPAERRRLVVRLTRETIEDLGWLVVEIEDAGVGLGAQADKVFDPFYTTKPGGLGMGLSISRSIIEGHGGRLWATANPDHGATFHLALPGLTEMRP